MIFFKVYYAPNGGRGGGRDLWEDTLRQGAEMYKAREVSSGKVFF